MKEVDYLNSEKIREGDTVFFKHGENLCKGKVAGVGLKGQICWVSASQYIRREGAPLVYELRLATRLVWHTADEVRAYAKAAWDRMGAI